MRFCYSPFNSLISVRKFFLPLSPHSPRPHCRISGDVVSGIVTKCLGARPKTKEGAIQVCLMFVEIEQQEVVLEEIMKGFSNKQPKIIAGAIQVITRILQ